MKLLAIDCSTQACSVAIFNDNAVASDQIIERYELAARSHTERVLPMVDALLSQAQYVLSDMDAIAFGCGPGSFTGLRICLGAVQGLAFGAELPVVPVSSLAALAQGALSENKHKALLRSVGTNGQILSTIDARMDEIYWGVYSVTNGLVELTGSEQLTAPEQLVLQPLTGNDNTILAVGNGLHYHSRIACHAQFIAVDDQLLPRAAAVAELARVQVANNTLLAPEKALPTYLRDEVAWKKQ